MTDHKTRHALERLGEFFDNQRDGAFAVELADALEAVTKGVQQHRKGGKLTITIALSPIKKTEDALSVRDSIKTSVPQAERPESLFFADAQGRLGVEHPSQRRLPNIDRRPAESDVGFDPTSDLRTAGIHAAAAAVEAEMRAQGHDVTVSATATEGAAVQDAAGNVVGRIVEGAIDDHERPRVVND